MYRAACAGRIWDAWDSAAPPAVLRPGPSFALLPLAQQQQLQQLSRSVQGGGGRGATAPLGVSTAHLPLPPVAVASSFQQGEEGQGGLVCCRFSPDGSFVFAGGSDCTLYVWHYPYTDEQQGGGKGACGKEGAGGESEPTNASAPASVASAGAGGSGAGGEGVEDAGVAGGPPSPLELCKLVGGG